MPIARKVVAAMLFGLVSCSFSDATAPTSDTQLSVSSTMLGGVNQFGHLTDSELQGTVFADDEGRGAIGLDSVAGLLYLQDYASGKRLILALPIAELSASIGAFERIADGDANIAALNGINPLENMPQGYNPEREGSPESLAAAVDIAEGASAGSARLLARRIGISAVPVGEILGNPHSEETMPEAMALTGIHSFSESWDPRCQNAAAMIGEIKSAYIHERRQYIQGLLDIIPWQQFVGTELGPNGTIDVSHRPDVIEAAFNALKFATDWRASIQYDWARVMYNSWHCEWTIKVRIAVQPWGMRVVVRSPPGGATIVSNPGISGGSGRYVCETFFALWSVSRDGGQTWETVSVPTTVCEQLVE
jgi:hypothetical protein